MKVYSVEWAGITAYYAARSRGRARAMAIRTIGELWELSWAELVKQCTVRRARHKESDSITTEGLVHG